MSVFAQIRQDPDGWLAVVYDGRGNSWSEAGLATYQDALAWVCDTIGQMPQP